MRKSAWLRRDASGIDEIHMHEFADNAAFSREYGDCSMKRMVPPIDAKTPTDVLPRMDKMKARPITKV